MFIYHPIESPPTINSIRTDKVDLKIIGHNFQKSVSKNEVKPKMLICNKFKKANLTKQRIILQQKSLDI